MSVLQGYYEKIRAQMVAQGGRSITEEGVCLYRGPNGCKCAVGALIPDEAYKPEIEGVPVTAATTIDGNWECCYYGANKELNGANKERNVLFASVLTASGIEATWQARDFLSRMQQAHDGAEDLRDLLVRIDRVAIDYNLPVVS